MDLVVPELDAVPATRDAPAADQERPLVDGWAAAIVAAALLALVVTLLVRRRTARIATANLP